MKHLHLWFRARRTPDGVVTAGDHHCFLGHKVSRGPHATPDGIYAQWEWDGKRLVAQNDRYGMFPVFYCCQGDDIAVSTSLVKLLAEGAPNELDYPAIAVFLRMSAFIGNDTPFKHIRVLPPNGRLEWEDGKVEVTGGRPVVREQRLSAETAVDALISLFSQAVARRAPASEEFAVPISGGHDSRHILLELCKQGLRPSLCVTVDQDDEADIARLVTTALRLPHKVVKFDEFWFRHELRKNVATHFCSAEIVELTCLLDCLKDNYIRTSYDGLAGDTIAAGPALCLVRLNKFKHGTVEEMAQAYFDVYGPTEESLRWLLSASDRRRMNRDAALAHMAEEMARHMDTHNPNLSFLFWSRTRRHTALSPYGLFAGIPTVHTPYLDSDLFDFLWSLPEDTTQWTFLQPEAIRRAYPEYAQIPYSSASRHSRGALSRRLANLWHQSRFILSNDPRQVRTFLSSLAVRFAPGRWLRPSFFHYMIQLRTLSSVRGARALLEMAEEYGHHGTCSRQTGEQPMT